MNLNDNTTCADRSVRYLRLEPGPSAGALAEYEQLLRRDPCAYCGGVAGAVDHIVPFRSDPWSSLYRLKHPGCTLGESDWREHCARIDQWDNWTGACRSCNSRKSNRPLLLFLAARRAA